MKISKAFVSTVLIGFSLMSIWVSYAEARVGRGTVGVRGSLSKRGKYVVPHVRTKPSRIKPRYNYSTRGNVNPHTGKRGTKSPLS